MLIQKQFVRQIEFVGQLKKRDDNDNATDAGDKNQSMFFSNLRKTARNEKYTIKQIKICSKI